MNVFIALKGSHFWFLFETCLPTFPFVTEILHHLALQLQCVSELLIAALTMKGFFQFPFL